MKEAVRDEIVAHSLRLMPFESGGVVTGYVDGDRSLTGEQFVPLQTIMPSSSRFLAAGDQVVRAVLTADRIGRQVVATVHSHPGGTTTPSRVDLDGAFGYDKMVHILVAISAGVPSIHGFHYERVDGSGARVKEALITLVP